MNTANSFKQMMEEDELLFPPPPDIEESIMGSLRILAIMGQAMELFIPKAFDMFILTLGGTLQEIDAVAKDELPGGDPIIDPDDLTPGTSGSFSDDDLIA